MKFAKLAAILGASYWAADFVLDRWIVKSDAGDPTGFILQADGFGLDDIIRLAAVGVVSASVLTVAQGR